MILRLSEVLDYVLYRSQQSKVNLSEEVAVINDFLALEKLRLGDKLDVSIRTEGSLSFAIAPLTILSLI
jgi:two-component system LytT family sensor kinase